jgi:hypothetical protein
MLVALNYKYAGSTAIDRIVGGFASNDEAAEWCWRNVATQPFDIGEVEHYEALDNPDDAALGDYFTAGYRPS